MGVMLRQVLKTFCAGNQWCYAVFWKIGCQNTKLLIWEECHYESTLHPDIPFGEWEGCSAETLFRLGIQADDRVQSLINKMMNNNPVNVVGEGTVGQAAFTGNHQWFLANNDIRDSHPSEIHNELHLQFSAGMQTVAVIPILPHGIVQLGSSLTIAENIGFVNYVKSLILQLGCVPGALQPDYGANESAKNPGVPVSNGMLASADSSGIFKVTSSTALAVDGYNQQSSSSQSSRLACQLLGSQGRQIQHNTQATVPTFQTPNVSQTFGKSHDDHCEQKYTPAMKPNLPFKGQQENGGIGADVIPLSSDAWLQASLYGSRSSFHHQSSAGCSSFKLTEKQNLADVAVQEHASKMVNESNGGSFVSSQLKKNGGLVGGSFPTKDLERSDLHGGVSNQISPISIPYSLQNPHKSAGINMYSTHLVGAGLKNASSSKDEAPLNSLVDTLTMSHTLSRGCNEGHSLLDAKHSRNNLPSWKGRVDNDLFQALNNPLTHPDQHMLSGQIPGFVTDCLTYDNGNMTSKSSDAKFEYGCMRPPSGDDLFDILGADFKNRLHNGNWNNLHFDGQHMGEVSSMSKNAPDASADFYSYNKGILDSDLFSGMGTEHLLDAVVSRAHSVTKQILDDNVSCQTTLTEISSSSIPTISPSSGQVSMSNLVQAELFGLTKSLAKAGTMGSSSFQSGCSKDDVGDCSQTTSIYGSHISSWVEQGQSVKRDGNVSTAYPKKNCETTKSNRKRLKPGENPRPRPKDRQMIQDRVKELREIVPNGAKCSIDALLERTIKHMLFLQSVTKHADKLKQTGESKIMRKEDSLCLKDNFEGGATWAFEVGSQSMVCPIIVEDLNLPRQLLVEMLCEERGFFLEIADLIRGLGLTILKGVMEARNDKIWAHFAVEADRDVTRMEIFLSLVHLLEQTVKGSTLANIALDNNLMVRQSLPQATSIYQ